jgi:hypothetical protein
MKFKLYTYFFLFKVRISYLHVYRIYGYRINVNRPKQACNEFVYRCKYRLKRITFLA